MSVSRQDKFFSCTYYTYVVGTVQVLLEKRRKEGRKENTHSDGRANGQALHCVPTYVRTCMRVRTRAHK